MDQSFAQIRVANCGMKTELYSFQERKLLWPKLGEKGNTTRQ